MYIWVMRHGEAGFNAAQDNQRSLTARGQHSAQEQGKWLAKRLHLQAVDFDKILVSPYLRTQQTLEAVLAGMQAVDFQQNLAAIETWSGITPNGNAQNVVNYARLLREEGVKKLLIISHLPLVYELVEQFTANQASVHFHPAVIAEIEWNSDCGKLLTSQYPA